MATIHTEDASDRLHLSLLSSPKDHDTPNAGVYSYHEEAQGQGCWVVIINTGYNWEQFPEVSQNLGLRALRSGLEDAGQSAGPRGGPVAALRMKQG